MREKSNLKFEDREERTKQQTIYYQYKTYTDVRLVSVTKRGPSLLHTKCLNSTAEQLEKRGLFCNFLRKTNFYLKLSLRPVSESCDKRKVNKDVYSGPLLHIDFPFSS